MNLHTSHNARLAGVVTALLLGLTARPVSAQAVPEVTQHTEDVVAEIPAEVEDETTWNIAAGANISTGNTRARNFNAGTDFYVLRDIHALSFRTAFVFGQADVDGGGPLQSTRATSTRGYARPHLPSRPTTRSSSPWRIAGTASRVSRRACSSRLATCAT